MATLNFKENPLILKIMSPDLGENICQDSVMGDEYMGSFPKNRTMIYYVRRIYSHETWEPEELKQGTANVLSIIHQDILRSEIS
jgi:hypothetical protein